MHTIVIGAGWAGLTAALELGKQGHRVTVLEAARQAGGRARSVAFGDIQIDNGQHLLIGAYHRILQLLQTIGLEESAVFERRPLQLLLRNPNNNDIRMQAAHLPAPVHMLVALLTASGLSVSERWQALRLCAALQGLKLESDISVAELLSRQGQSSRLIDELWQPLCLAIMNTPTPLASAEIFVRVLIDAFLHRRSDSDLLIPRRDLGAIIPEPAIKTIRAMKGDVRLSCKVQGLTLVDRHIKDVILSDGSTIEADQFIIATAPHACQRLLDKQAVFEDTRQQLSRLDSAPISTVYLQYPAQVRADIPMTGMNGTVGQWLFDRRVCGQHGLMAVVISGHGEHEQMDNNTLAERVTRELALLFPRWPEPVQSLVIREKRATFVCHNGVNAHRPGHRTPAHNAWLAGDYTDTGYPATLEGAVRSGLSCVQALVSTMPD